MCLYIYNLNSQGTMSYSNIVKNNSPNPLLGVLTIRSLNTFLISECIFIDNTDLLIKGIDKGLIIISNSFFRHNYQYSLINHTSVTTINTVSTSIFTQTYILSHYFTYFCELNGAALSLDDSPCQSLPPPPTICEISNKSEAIFMSLTSVFQVSLLLLT